jgi:GH24 family phage-related lysozyme (muramidase)
MTPSNACVSLVQQFEGCAKKQSDGTMAAYPDPGTGGDPWTIGWGSTGPDVKQGMVWTQQQCDDRLAADLTSFSAGVTSALGGAATTQCQFDAMVSFSYNVGLGNLKSSTLLKKHKAGDYPGAALEFPKWNKAAGKVLPGLVRRRAAEAALYSESAA